MKRRSVLFLILCPVLLLITFARPFLHACHTAGTVCTDRAIAICSRQAAILLKKPPEAVRVISFNLLADIYGCDGSDAALRAPSAEEILRSADADILCLQETSPTWFACLGSQMYDTFSSVQPARTVLFMKLNVTMYNRSTLKLIKSGIVQFSVGNDTRSRCAVWAVFEQRQSGRKYAVINCHFNLIKSNFDMLNPLSCANQANEVCKLADDLSEMYDCPVIAAGDFNCREHKTKTDSSYIYSRLISYFTDARTEAESVFVGAQKNFNSTSSDHIFIKGAAAVKAYSILSLPQSETVSDHFAVFADFL